MVVEIAISATITVTAKVNARQGAPSTSAPVLRKYAPGTILQVSAIAAGEEVQGNPLWFRLNPATYLWSGACSAIQSGVAVAPLPQPFPDLPDGAVVFPSAPPANVIDIFHANRVTNFAAAREAGVLGVIHKASTGATGRDDAYRRRRQPAVDAGLLWGAYHWGTAAPAVDQVANFLNWAEPDDHTLVALDYERDVGNQMTLARAREFLEELSQRLGRRAVIYSGETIKSALGDHVDPFFGQHRLWLAQYGPRPVPQASWSQPWLWQFTEGKATDPRRRPVPGVPGNANGELDGDFYAGTAEQLAAEWAS